jgi:hypothetical protein
MRLEAQTRPATGIEAPVMPLAAPERRRRPLLIEAWRATFPETDLDDRNLMAVRRVIIGTIRGSTIHEMWSNEKDSSANDLAVLKAFLKFHLAAQ